LPDYSNIRKNYFDRKRDEFLASIYGEDFSRTERIYKDILNKMVSAGELSEVDQKAIRQIQHAFKIFRKPVTENLDEGINHIYENVRKILTGAARAQVRHVTYIGYDTWYKKIGLRKEQFQAMLSTVSTLQMTVGCSVHCRRCNEWALPGPRKHFSFDAVTRLIKELFDSGNSEFALYGASDPLDWKHGEKSIIHILAFMSAHGYQTRYGLLTKVPRNSEKKVEILLNTGADIGFSITEKNRQKVIALEKLIGKPIETQHDFKELLIPAGLDEDFSSIKSSITDNYGTEITPEGASIIIPTFTSALNPTGQRRIPVTADTNFFLKKKVGRDALPVEYFKPLEAIDLQGQNFTLDTLFEAQIENIFLDNGLEDLVPPGMMNLHEYFRTYEPDAVRRRKTLFPTVARGLRKEILLQAPHKRGTGKNQYQQFKRAVRDYHLTTSMETVIRFKKNAFSYYLSSIVQYLKKHPTEKEIVRYLRRKDFERYKTDYPTIFEAIGHGLDVLLEELETDTSILFEILLLMLVENPDHQIVQAFIKNNPVGPKDRFL